MIGGVLVDLWSFTTALTAAVLGPVLAGILLLFTHTQLPPLKHRNENFPEEALVDSTPSIRQVIFGIVGIQGIVASLNYVMFSIFLTYMPLLSTQVIGSDATGTGALFSIQGLVNLIVVIPLAKLADRKGKRLFMILGLLGSGIAFVGMVFSNSYGMLVVFTILFSFSFATFGPAAVALLSERVSKKQQGVAIGMYGVFEDGGMIAGSALGGFLWEGLGHVATFLSGAGAAMLGSLITLRFLKDHPSTEEETPGTGNHLP
jgi:MFS family permease